jgi:endoglycosylceramidase
MPQPGQIDQSYLDSIIQTAQMLERHGLYVLFDFHQDGWGVVTHGNGMPAWATFTDGLPNPTSATFPLYYIQNPALQHAFDNFWANRVGPNGVPLQEYYAQGMRAVASRVADDPHVLGYEAMNEPWPGTNWSECVTACPDLEAQLLAPFYNRMAAAIRSVDRVHPLLEEPFVLFNFGRETTSLPGAIAPPGTATRVLATHDYALSAEDDIGVMDNTVAAAQRDGTPAVIDEFGATTDTTMIERLENGYDDHLLPWLFWAYNEEVVFNSSQPLVPPNVRVPVLDVLTRPYPTAVNGTPTKLHFDDATTTFDFDYATTRPDGRQAAPGLETVVSVPTLRYPSGYAVTVTGATVTSSPCASTLTLRNDPRATTVTVQVVPASMCKGGAAG